MQIFSSWILKVRLVVSYGRLEIMATVEKGGEDYADEAISAEEAWFVSI